MRHQSALVLMACGVADTAWGAATVGAPPALSAAVAAGPLAKATPYVSPASPPALRGGSLEHVEHPSPQAAFEEVKALVDSHFPKYELHAQARDREEDAARQPAGEEDALYSCLPAEGIRGRSHGEEGAKLSRGSSVRSGRMTPRSERHGLWFISRGPSPSRHGPEPQQRRARLQRALEPDPDAMVWRLMPKEAAQDPRFATVCDPLDFEDGGDWGRGFGVEGRLHSGYHSRAASP
mmetsp:Transcript_7018/g.17841  ORF Transcript_7018/g.17841 Transcript_7018/m.17841 type:complete len:236 (-) Transcript_7018:62-769(-)